MPAIAARGARHFSPTSAQAAAGALIDYCRSRRSKLLPTPPRADQHDAAARARAGARRLILKAGADIYGALKRLCSAADASCYHFLFLRRLFGAGRAAEPPALKR